MEERTKFFEIIPQPEVITDETFCTKKSHDDKEGLWFRPVVLNENETEEIMKEINEWEFIDKYSGSYENMAYEDKSSWSGERVITDDLLVSMLKGSHVSNQVRGGYLLKNGHFAGIVMALEDVTSFGMAYQKEDFFSALLTDGTKYGKTSFHYFHSSTEISESNDSEYLLRRKQ